MKNSILILAFATMGAFMGCTPKGTETSAKANAGVSELAQQPSRTASELAKYHKATFAGGCFWCEEAVFESIQGVEEVISGYSGGKTDNPTYEETGTGQTGHAEAIEVYYDSSKVDYPTLLKVYFASIDPTQANGQGPDHGSQYRSVIFPRNPAERGMAEQYIAKLNASGKYSAPIAVEILPFERFWKAETYHQDYVYLHPESGYVQHESIPRLKRTQAQVKDLVKPGKLRI